MIVSLKKFQEKYGLLDEACRQWCALSKDNNSLQRGDILSFEELDDDRILISRESLCCCIERTPIEKKKENLLDFLNSLSPEQKAAALVHLSMQVSENVKV